MKKTVSILAFLMAACLSLFTLASCLSPAESVQEGSVYVSLRINPEIELIADNSGTVIAANAINDDGECVLAETDLVGESIEDAAESFTQTATELGYVDPDGKENVVYVDVQGESEENAEKVRRSLSEKINRYFENNGIYGKVSPETLDRYREEIDAWKVSAGHAKMILRILDLYPEKTAEELLALSVKERIALLKDDKTNNGLTAEIRKAYADDVKALREEYADLFTKQARLKEIETKLKDQTLTEEETEALTTEYETLQKTCDELCASYREKLSELKQTRKNEVEAAKEKTQKEAKTRRENHQDKLGKHREKIEKDKETIAKNIRDWQKK